MDQASAHKSDATQAGQDPSPRTPLTDAAEQAFLSPRVVDRATFEEYTALLRSTIAESTKESELLARRAEAAAVILEQLERFLGENGDAIERAAEILTNIDSRSHLTAQLLDTLDDRGRAIDKRSQDAVRAAEERAEAFEHRLRTIVDTAMDRFEETEDQLAARAASARRSLVERLEAIRTKGEAACERLEARARDAATEAETEVERAAERTASARADLAAILDRAERAAQRIAEREAEAEHAIVKLSSDAQHAIAGSADAKLASITEALDRLAARESATVAATDAATDAACTRARDALAEATAAATDRAEAIRSELDAAVADADARLLSAELRALLDRCEQAERDAEAAAETRAKQLGEQQRAVEAAVAASRAEHDASAERLQALLTTLEPLRPLLDPDAPVESIEPYARLTAAVAQAIEAKPKPKQPDPVDSTARLELAAMSEALLALTERVMGLEKSVSKATSPKSDAAPRKATPKKKAASKKSPPKKTSPRKAAKKSSQPVTPELKPEPKQPAEKSDAA